MHLYVNNPVAEYALSKNVGSNNAKLFSDGVLSCNKVSFFHSCICLNAGYELRFNLPDIAQETQPGIIRS